MNCRAPDHRLTGCPIFDGLDRFFVWLAFVARVIEVLYFKTLSVLKYKCRLPQF